MLRAKEEGGIPRIFVVLAKTNKKKNVLLVKGKVTEKELPNNGIMTLPTSCWFMLGCVVPGCVPCHLSVIHQTYWKESKMDQ